MTNSSFEPIIRLSFSVGLFLVLALAECYFPRRRLTFLRKNRWPSNIAITVIDVLVMRMILPLGAVGFARIVQSHGWGILNSIAFPAWIEVLIAVTVLDLAIYSQHLVFHHVPLLWRIHRMHHTDLDFDVTTGSRFHPAEIALSLGIKLAVITVLGAPAIGVLVFEILLNATALFNHSNLKIPTSADRFIRRFLVTPDMHRVHHSILKNETNSNFGFNLPWWDHLFRTYQKTPKAGHESMTIGTDVFRNPKELRLDRLLIQPFIFKVQVSQNEKDTVLRKSKKWR
ncbi:MAG: sterol desaturase family protein [Bacteriovoracia bacterium]